MRLWLQRLFYRDAGTIPNAQALQEAISALEGKARFDGPEQSVFIRVAEQAGDIYIDCGDLKWTAIRITSGGWEMASPSR